MRQRMPRWNCLHCSPWSMRRVCGDQISEMDGHGQAVHARVLRREGEAAGQPDLRPEARPQAKKLQKRVADGQLVCILTPGGWSWCPSRTTRRRPRSTPARMGRSPCSTPRRSQRRSEKIGEDHKHESRHRKTFIVHSMNIAELYILWKDHKNTPASRPSGQCKQWV